MAVYSKKYLMSPGSYYFIAPELTNVSILKVARQGMTHYVTFNEAAGDLQYIYSPSTGGMVFDQNNPFVITEELIAGGSYVDNVEKIFVKWKV